MTHFEKLTRLAGDVLVSGLPEGLRSLLAEYVDAGQSDRDIMWRISAVVRQARPPGGGKLTIAACEEYLSRYRHGNAERPLVEPPPQLADKRPEDLEERPSL